MNRRPLSRRSFLRGTGTALALPFLEAMLPARSFWSGAGQPPTRVAWLYVPNGAHMPAWTPATEGADFELPHILQPLEPWRDRLSVLSGLAHHHAAANGDGPGDHARASAVFLTGVQPLKKDGAIGLGRSADQVAAKAVGGATRFPSLELGCERGGNSGQCDSGYSCAYSSNVSWQDERTPTGKEVNPRLVFDRLFRGGAAPEDQEASADRLKRRRSLLDYVADDAKRLRRDLGRDDRDTVDGYLEQVREVERRLEKAAESVVEDVPDEARPEGVPADFQAHLELMADLLVLAFRTDSTRIATWMLANEGSNRSYRMINVKDGHHSLSHHGKDEAKQSKIRDINRWHAERLAYLMQRLAETPDGDASLLDRCMLVYGSNIGDGNRHNHNELPILLLGGGNGTLSPGRHVRYEKNTPLMDLHLALLERMGVPYQPLGDSRGVLEGI